MHDFEWDEAKATANQVKHRVTFELATLAFKDRFAVELFDEVAVDGEQRYTLVGMAQLSLLVIVYTERNERIRIISARHATRAEEKLYDDERRGQ